MMLPKVLPSDRKREWHIKCEAEPGPYGSLPNKRPIAQHLENGFVNMDKQAGPTSREVVDWVKRILKLNKAGHCGTLDPKVTGCFPVGLMNATKVAHVLLPAGKEYICVMRLHKEVPRASVEAVLKYFVGEIYQRPPLRSAVKRQLRTRHIYYIEVLEQDGQDVLFRVGCAAGTYIRTLCLHAGMVLGVGAHMSELRRTRTGPFNESTIVTLQELSEARYLFETKNDESLLRRCVQPLEAAIAHLPKIVVQDSAVEAICQGAKILAPGVCKLQEYDEGDLLAILSLKGELIALATPEMDFKHACNADKGIVAKVQRVILKQGTYPKMWGANKPPAPVEV